MALFTLLMPFSNISAKTLDYNKPQEHSCLAEAIYFEASGHERDEILVGLTIVNRTHKPEQFGDSICKVVHQKNQYTFVSKHLKVHDFKEYAKAETIATNILQGNQEDITHGATYFYNIKSDNPSWRHKMKETLRTEYHSYRKPVAQTRNAD